MFSKILINVKKYDKQPNEYLLKMNVNRNEHQNFQKLLLISFLNTLSSSQYQEN